MTPKKPQTRTPSTAQRAVAPVPSHISIHCKAVKGTSAQAKLLPKAQRAPVAPPVHRPKPTSFPPPKAVQPKMATPVPPKRATAPKALGRPSIQLARPATVGPARAVIQRMIEESSSSSSSSSEVMIMISSSSDALLRFTRSSDDAVIEVSHDSSNDQLNGTFTKNGKAVGGNFVTYTNYNKGDMRPDDTRAPERYCHQGYIEVNKTLRQQGISYVLAYAGAAYARTELGHTRVGTNSVNQNSGPLAKALGFKAIGEIQILSATTVMQQASVGMNKYGWLVTGGTLASTLGISSSSSITRTTTVSERSRLLDDDPPQSKWCCCFLTTACCRWRGLPDDCEELTLLRHYRDTYLRNSEAGSAAIERYYEIAPSIAAAIDRDRDARKIYDWIYEVIQRCLGAMQRADYDSVFEQYKQMVLELEQRYCTQR